MKKRVRYFHDLQKVKSCKPSGPLLLEHYPGFHSMMRLPCNMKILREFYFADWRFFVVCGNKFLRFEMTEVSAGN